MNSDEFGLGMGNGTGKDTYKSMPSKPPPRLRLHPMASQNAMQGEAGEYAEATLTRSCGEHRQSCRCRRTRADKISVNDDDTGIYVCNYI